MIISTSAVADGFIGDDVLKALAGHRELRDCAASGRCEEAVNLAGTEFAVQPVGIGTNGRFALSLVSSGSQHCGSAGCQSAIVEENGGHWRVLMEGYNINLLRSTTNGYHDVLLGYKGKGFEFQGPFPLYKWDGQRYTQDGVMDVNP